MLPELTDQQRQDALAVASLHTDGERIRLDLRDDVQYRHAVAFHTVAGQTPETHPGLHQALALAREQQFRDGGPGEPDAPDSDGFSTGAVIAGIGYVRGGQAATAEGFATVLGGAAVLTAVLNVVDTDQGRLLASGSGDQYGDGTYLGVATDVGTAQPTVANMLGLLQYTSQKVAGAPAVVEQVRLAAAQLTPSDTIITQPVKSETTSGEANLRIGLGRGRTDQKNDVDYRFWQSPDNLSYAVPMVGSATFGSPVVEPLSESATATAWLARAKGDPAGSGGVMPAPDDKVANILNALRVSGPTLTWHLPAASGPTGPEPASPGNPINWGPLSWTSGEIVHVVVQFSVQLQGQGVPGFVAVQSVDGGRDVDPIDGIATIPALDFLYCCVAGDAIVTLADGSGTRLDELQCDELVTCPAGGEPVRVCSTRLAPFQGDACRIVVDGRELVLSPNHLVIAEQGPVRADALTTDDEIRVADGYARLDEPVSTVPYDGLLCNPSLSRPGDAVHVERNQLLVNGIAVSDHELQVHESARTRNDPDRIRGLLDERFLPDYEGHRRRTVAAERERGDG